MKRRLGAVIALALTAVACGGSATSDTSSAIADVSDVHIFAASVEAPSGVSGIAQVVADLHNASDAKDALVSVSCSCGGTATLFEPGATKPATSIAMPSQKVVLFGPRGARIELSHLPQPLTVGSTVNLTFSFQTASPASATAAVQQPGSLSPAT
ncbi:MAG TPA: copper chaperone PCu(A)C [Actinomycetota bacterium]|jgi:copper(I)-binding protein|nr:copper chaperone PCu(A)C [Actinomycetota bacterium]